jgi:excisionase family DNA binding protein
VRLTLVAGPVWKLMSTENNHDPLLTMQEAGRYLDVAPRTVRREIARGNLEGTFFGRLVRVRRSALERYIESVTR